MPPQSTARPQAAGLASPLLPVSETGWRTRAGEAAVEGGAARKADLRANRAARTAPRWCHEWGAAGAQARGRPEAHGS